MNHVTQRSAKRVLALVGGGLGLMLVIAACGGGEPTLNELIEDASDLSGTTIDGAISDNNVTTTLGDASVGFGDNLGRPDWLESWFELPDGLSIDLAVDDPSTGERAIQGIVTGTDAANVEAQQRTMLEAAGYEALQDSGYFVQTGQPTIQVSARDFEDGTVGYVFERSFETEQTLRDVYAPIEGVGVLTVSLNGEELRFEGQCSLRSTSGQFSSDDALGQLTVELREGEQDYILGSVINADAANFESWSVLQVTDAGDFPTVTVDSSGFDLAGFMVDSSFSNPTPVTMDVTCPG